MKLDVSLWNVGFTVIIALSWAYYTLARSRHESRQILLENAERFEKLYRERDEENVRLRDRVKELEGDVKTALDKYERLWRRVVEVEEYLDLLLTWADRHGHTVPPRPVL